MQNLLQRHNEAYRRTQDLLEAQRARCETYFSNMERIRKATDSFLEPRSSMLDQDDTCSLRIWLPIYVDHGLFEDSQADFYILPEKATDHGEEDAESTYTLSLRAVPVGTRPSEIPFGPYVQTGARVGSYSFDTEFREDITEDDVAELAGFEALLLDAIRCAS